MKGKSTLTWMLALTAAVSCSKSVPSGQGDSTSEHAAGRASPASPPEMVLSLPNAGPSADAPAAPGPEASFAASAQPASQAEAPDFPHFPKEFQVTAMRGVAPGGPSNGNTIQSFRTANEKGVRYVEVDVFTTKDGVLVSAHEAGIEHCGVIQNMRSETLLNCTMPHGFRVASLQQILAFPFSGIFVDLKETKHEEAAESVVRIAAKAVIEAGRQKDVVLMMYTAPESVVRMVHEQGIRAGLKGYPASSEDTLEIVRKAAAAHFEMVCVKAMYVTPELVRESAKLGVWHLPWSIAAHTAQHWQELAAAGAGGLIVLHFDKAQKEILPHWQDPSYLWNGSSSGAVPATLSASADTQASPP